MSDLDSNVSEVKYKNSKPKRISELEDGEYIIFEYSPTMGQYGLYYIIDAQHEFENVRFYSNKYLTDYIRLFNPKRRIPINITNGFINIHGYQKHVKLI